MSIVASFAVRAAREARTPVGTLVEVAQAGFLHGLPAASSSAATSRNDRRGFVLTRRGFHRRSLGGLCVEVTVPISPSFRFSPLGLDDDGPGLCVELVLPIVCPEESCPEEGLGPTACPEEPCPEEGLDAPPVFSAKDSVVVPAKRAIATAAAAILRCILHSLSFADARIKQRADKLEVRYGDAHHAVSSAGFFCSR